MSRQPNFRHRKKKHRKIERGGFTPPPRPTGRRSNKQYMAGVRSTLSEFEIDEFFRSEQTLLSSSNRLSKITSHMAQQNIFFAPCTFTREISIFSLHGLLNPAWVLFVRYHEHQDHCHLWCTLLNFCNFCPGKSNLRITVRVVVRRLVRSSHIRNGHTCTKYFKYIFSFLKRLNAGIIS